MATKFVYSGAAGLNDGSSWADAWTSAASSTGVAAGDIVKIHKTHSETGLTTTQSWSNGTISNPVRLVCVDKDNSDALATGAVIGWNTDATGPGGNIYGRGLTLQNSGSRLISTPAANGKFELDTCILKVTGAGGINFAATTARWLVRFTNVTVDFSAASNAGVVFTIPNSNNFEWIGGEYILRSPQTTLFAGVSAQAGILVRGVKFTGTCTNILTTSSTVYGTYNFEQCVLPTYTNLRTGTQLNPVDRINFNGCVPAGTLTVPGLAPNIQADYHGSLAASLSRYRTGGANDGYQTNEYSWAITSTANVGALTTPFQSPLLVKRVAAGSQTLTFYVASGVTLTDEELWVELLTPSEDVSPTGLPVFRTSRCQLLATPASLTTDGSSTWNGSGVGTKQKISFSIAPTIAGIAVARFFFAKASTTVYVDPGMF